MPAGAHELDPVVEDAVDESMFLRDAPCPRIRSQPLEGLRFADAPERVAPERGQEIHEAQRDARLGRNPVPQILVERRAVD